MCYYEHFLITLSVSKIFKIKMHAKRHPYHRPLQSVIWNPALPYPVADLTVFAHAILYLLHSLLRSHFNRNKFAHLYSVFPLNHPNTEFRYCYYFKYMWNLKCMESISCKTFLSNLVMMIKIFSLIMIMMNYCKVHISNLKLTTCA